MDMTTLANNPVFIGVVAGIVGILIGWFFTRRGWRKRAEEAESRAADLAAAQKREQREGEDAAQQVQQLQASLKSAQDELEQARARITELESEAEEAHTEQADAESVAEVRAGETSDLQMQLSLLQEEFDAATQNAASELEKARTEAEMLAAARVALEAELSALREEAETAREQASAMRAQVEAATQAAQNKEIALSEAYEHAVVVQKQLEEREEALGVAQGELDGLRAEIAALNKSKGDMEQRLQRSRSDVAGELAVLTSTMLKMKDEALEDANARIAQLTKELEALRR